MALPYLARPHANPVLVVVVVVRLVLVVEVEDVVLVVGPEEGAVEVPAARPVQVVEELALLAHERLPCLRRQLDSVRVVVLRLELARLLRDDLRGRAPGRGEHRRRRRVEPAREQVGRVLANEGE